MAGGIDRPTRWSLTPSDPDEVAVELARRRHDRTQRLAAATVKRLHRSRGLDAVRMARAS